MSTTWKHPSFGEFEQKASTFVATVKIPAFKRFSYDTGYSNARRSTGKVGLTFSPWLSNEKLAKPTREMVKLAEKTLADADHLVDLVAQALWEEFNGRGPTTGMWWYGGLETVTECCVDNDLPAPAKPQDLLAALRLYVINIYSQYWEYPHPIAMLTFHTAFEEEHGVSMLTDGEMILGSGYAGEPEIGKRVRKRK